MFGENPFGNNKKSKNVFGGGDLLGSKSKKKNKREPVTKTQKDAVWHKQDGMCAKCGSKLSPITTEYDHIKEVQDGGKSTISNIQALCKNCHGIKNHKTRLKKIEKKKSEKRKKEKEGFGLWGGGSF